VNIKYDTNSTVIKVFIHQISGIGYPLIRFRKNDGHRIVAPGRRVSVAVWLGRRQTVHARTYEHAGGAFPSEPAHKCPRACPASLSLPSRSHSTVTSTRRQERARPTPAPRRARFSSQSHLPSRACSPFPNSGVLPSGGRARALVHSLSTLDLVSALLLLWVRRRVLGSVSYRSPAIDNLLMARVLEWFRDCRCPRIFETVFAA
jgi:hypothetical protein